MLIGCQNKPVEKTEPVNDEKPYNQQSADMILQSGKIYTVDKETSIAEAVAIKGKEIVAVGTNEEIKSYQGEETKVIDLGGKMVLPGFFDSHTHVTAAIELFGVDLFGLKTIEEYQQALKEFIEDNPDVDIVQGTGWINGAAPDGGPKKEVIDEIIPDIPVILYSEDGHSVWVNSKTLKLAGITKDTKDPKAGVIERDPATGEPSGTFRENAASLVSDVIDDYSVEEYIAAIEKYQELAAERGVTSVHVLLGSSENGYEAFKQLEKEGKLTIRYRGSLETDPKKGPEQVNELIKKSAENKGELFQTNSAKIFTDGVIEGGTAFLEEKYKHQDTNGSLEWEDLNNFNEVFAALDKEGYQIHVHSIGDAATRITLDGMEYAKVKNGERDSRHGITHIQLVNEEDFKRFHNLGVIALPQPFWHMKQPGYYEEIEVPFLGRERAEREYPMKSFVDAGVVVASGSDFTVTPEFSPLHGIQYGVTRTEIGNDDPDAVANPKERLSVEEMIASFTINGAYANFLDDITGSIEIGKLADLVVIDKNLLDIPATEISNTKVLLTLLEGKEVYRNSAFE